jgi:hypothetical protein
MRDGYTIDNDCYAYGSFFKCVKVYNYHTTNKVTNAVSGTFYVNGTTQNLVGFWKIKTLKQ